MASINISEDDFTCVAGAACDAQNRGDMKAARALDKLARKINAALTAKTVRPYAMAMGNPPAKPVTWKDMPSTLEPLARFRG